DHQDYPLALLDPELLRLTGVNFVLHGGRNIEARLGPLEAEPFDLEWHATTFDLDVQMIESAEALWGSILFRPEVFEPASMRRMSGHFRQLLEAAVAEPLQPIARLPLISAGEQKALAAWNATTRVWPDQATLPDLFERQAAQQPDRVAAYCGSQNITYAALDQRANQVAQYLRAQGVELESLVGIHMPRSLDLLAAVLGVLKAGAAYVPIDPAYPPERQRFLLDDCRPLLVLDNLEAVRDFPCTPVGRQLAAGNLAYVIYTSGSSGTPKGVMATHAGAVNRCRWMWEAYPFEPGENSCQRTSLSFVDSVWEIFGPLLAGVPITIEPDETVKDTSRFAATLETSQVTRITVVPSLLRALLEFPLPQRLKYWIVSGEALTIDLARRFRAQLPHAVLLNLYGCSEASGDSTCWQVPREFETATIGHPIANTQVYILDRSGNELPAGLPGEIAIGGRGLARGYINQGCINPTSVQEEKFGAFLAGSTERLYRSGDLGRWLEDGTIEYLGRADNQVKIRGARVELGEVEAALASDDAVAQAAVRAWIDPRGETRLVACVVFRPGARADFSALRNRLSTRLADYMIPAHHVALDSLPLLPNGKVDRAALPEPELVAPGGAEPRTPVQELLAGIWSTVLHIERVGIQDDFFDLGGHSLLAAQVIARVREVFQKDLPLRLLFENTTVERLAAAIEQAAAPNASAPRLFAAPVAAQVPLSFGQQRLWFLEQVGASLGAYNIAAAVRLEGPLRVDSVRAALNEIARRHRVLRTRVVQVDGELAGVVDEVQNVPFAVEETTEPELYSRTLKEAARPFDLGCAPLLRGRLLRVSQTKHVLVTTVHHIAADGWSMGLVAREFGEFYCGRPLPELPVQYSDYAQWQRTHLAGEVLEAGLSYWRKHLEAARNLLIGKASRPAKPSGYGARVVHTMPPETSAALKALARRENATLFITLLGAYYVLLAAYSGDQDIVVGCPYANRTHVEVEGLIGFFANTVLLRANISGAVSFEDVLMRARETSLGAYTHQDVPLEKIIEDLRPRRQGARYPLFNAALALQNAPFQPVKLPDLKVTSYPLHTGTAKVDVWLDVLDVPEGLICSLEYSVDCFDESAAARLLRNFAAVLTTVADDPSVALSSLLALIKPAAS
ncbi:MAG: amino acid adenylation domain-containing protein, partial [Bryobacterales bacterium]|nr:amino acid adenylation domain-containing protein [Bryobacterales bacterium]